MDRIVFAPRDVDLARSPLRRGIAEPTFVLGAFNPGMTRLPSGNLLLMVRVAEALAEPVAGGMVRAIRWTPAGFVLDAHDAAGADLSDPRYFTIRNAGGTTLLALTSLSWLLPVELDPDGERIVAVHYDRAIVPEASSECYGVEDARISRIGARWYMTSCGVSPERHGTVLRVSDDALTWRSLGLVLDHQNKDMLLFEGLVGGRFMALTRPLGTDWFGYPAESPWAGGPSVNLATSPDALHWRPVDAPGLRARKGARATTKLGGGTPPVLTDDGWLEIYHGVERDDDRHGAGIGTYRSFWALLDRDDPSRIVAIEDETPLIEAAPALTAHLDGHYLPSPVVFSTGIVDAGDHWLVASGEGDFACRLTAIPKRRFARHAA